MLKLILSISILFFLGQGFSQERIMVTKNFQFQDGVYLSFESLKKNQPDLPMDSIDMVLFVNPQTHLAQVDHIVLKSDRQAINLDSIWGLSINGIPYKKVDHSNLEKPLTTFAGLKARGKLCYYSFTATNFQEVPIRAYNPLNGRPFRTGTITKPEEVLVEMMIHWETGEEKYFNKENLLQLIQDDKALSNTVRDLKEDEIEEKLFKCLLIYVDRNPVYLDKTNTSSEDQ
jgi:hypothetical protein